MTAVSDADREKAIEPVALAIRQAYADDTADGDAESVGHGVESWFGESGAAIDALIEQGWRSGGAPDDHPEDESEWDAAVARFFASRPGGAPVAPTREALAEALDAADASWSQPATAGERSSFYLNRADALLSSGLLGERREDVQAEALEAFADDYYGEVTAGRSRFDAELAIREHAAELRKGPQS